MQPPTPADSPAYPAVIIEGHVLVQSPLHVGDGGDGLPWTDRDLPADRERPDLAHCKQDSDAADPDCLYQGVCHDYHWPAADGADPDPDQPATAPGTPPTRVPYLPGSTLRGLLRRLLARTPDADTIADLLGRTPHGPGDAQGGRLRLHDAPLLPASGAGGAPPPFWSAVRQTAARHGIALDPRTGSVAEGLLFSHELIPPGARFALTIEASDLSEPHLRALLAALRTWDGDLDSALGARTGKGWGRVRWQPTAVRVLTEAALTGWLRGDDPKAPLPFANHADLLAAARPPDPTLTGAPSRPIGLRHGRLYLDLALRPEGPILVHEPGRRPLATQDDPHPPQLYFSRAADGTPLLPGSSLVGLVRARARRILVTIAAGLPATHADPGAPTDTGPTAGQDRAERIADALLARLFGDPTRRGALWLGDGRADGALAAADAKADEATQVRVAEQTFIAIDRFTGGGKSIRGEGALYKVEAAVGGSFRAPLLLETGRLTRQEQDQDHPHWWKGLLLLVARDAIEGDLALGWGKARGLGAIRVTLHPSAAVPQPRWEGDLKQPIHRLASGHGEGWPRLLAWLAAQTTPGPADWLADLHKRIALEATRPAQPPDQPPAGAVSAPLATESNPAA